MANDQERVIKIRIDATGQDAALKSLASSMVQLNQSTARTTSILESFQTGLNSILGASFLGIGITSLTNMADSIQLVTDRLKVLVGTQEEANKVFAELQTIAGRTKQDITELSGVYTRLAASTKNVGLSQETLLGLTETLANSFRLSGSTAEETSGALVQLSQAMSRGAIRGQELNSIITQNSYLATIFGKEISKTGMSTQQFAEKGLFTTTEFLKIMAKYQDEINTKAKELSPTFGQTATLAMNKFKVAVDGVNKSLDLSGNFAKFVEFAIDNIPLVIAGVSSLALVALPGLITSIGGTTIALNTLYASLNPISLILAGFVVYIAATSNSLEEFSLKVKKSFLLLRLTFQSTFESIVQGFAKLETLFEGKSTGKINEFLKATKEVSNGIGASIAEVDVQLKKLENSTTKVGESVGKIGTTEAKANIGTIKEQIAALNLAFEDGKLTLDSYYNQLGRLEQLQLDERFKKAALSVRKYNDEKQKLDMTKLQREFEVGRLSIEQYDLALRNLKLVQLKQDYDDATISAAKYHKEVVATTQDLSSSAFYDGVNNYLDQIGTISQQISGATTRVFGNLEDAIFNFTKTGKFEFSKFAQSVIDDLNRIIIRSLILRPLANALLSAGAADVTGGGGGAAGSISGPNTMSMAATAKGGIYDSGRIQKFATGGVVNTPTYFANGGASKGLMGEAGAEGILPLKRLPGGALGVQSSGNTVVNIINQSGANIEQREKVAENGDKTLEILITSAVKSGISSGKFDKQFESTYGMRRKGV